MVSSLGALNSAYDPSKRWGRRVGNPVFNSSRKVKTKMTTPRLKEKYVNEVAPKLFKELECSNVNPVSYTHLTLPTT